MENPSKWYSRSVMGSLGVFLVAIGIWMAIIFLPTRPILSFLLFILIGGPGVLIGYKRKSRWIFLGGFWIASWGYPFGLLFVLTRNVVVANDFYPYSFAIMFPVAALGLGLTLAVYRLSPNRRKWEGFKIVALFYMLIMTPFIWSAVFDYNVRFDTSPPQVINMKIVDKYIDHEDAFNLQVETLDGRLTFFLNPPESYYDEHNVGDLIEVTAHRGALGGMWIEYK